MLRCVTYAPFLTRRLTVVTDVLKSAMSTEGLDETQIKLLEEQCILVNEDDKKIGAASKKTCHMLSNINKGMLHRAFSVFLFNKEGELLIQQRSSAKITFPLHFTNTCCSHPLNTTAELDERDALGVRRAAQRKLQHELGIDPYDVPLSDFKFLTRIHYMSENVPADGMWGEHEIDYILFIQKKVKVNQNDNEVASHRYVNQEELKHLLETSDEQDVLITPWFRLIADTFLFKWWKSLDCLDQHFDKDSIHRMVKPR